MLSWIHLVHPHLMPPPHSSQCSPSCHQQASPHLNNLKSLGIQNSSSSIYQLSHFGKHLTSTSLDIHVYTSIKWSYYIPTSLYCLGQSLKFHKILLHAIHTHTLSSLSKIHISWLWLLHTGLVTRYICVCVCSSNPSLPRYPISPGLWLGW